MMHFTASAGKLVVEGSLLSQCVQPNVTPDRALTLEEQERPVLLHPRPRWLHYCQSRERWW